MTAQANRETLGFQTEVKQLLHLMIHSLYSNKEIFLRELISNASDAVDKLKFEALKDDSLVEGDADYSIHISFDKEANTVTIADNGVGMSRDEVIQNLGTIAKSGTAEFLKQLTGDQQKDAQLIGQFGVGFYSAFVVADSVTVFTRKAGLAHEEGVRWESSGDGEFTIENVDKPQRGTEITLHLREDSNEFADGWRLRSIIRKYSDHISVPILMEKMDTGEESEDEEKKEEKAKEDEVINKATALWTRPRTDISDEEYKEFYKHVSHDFEDPLTWSHNKVEGKTEYTSLLYIPKRAPFDLYQREAPRGLKLYVQRVFIMDDAEQFLPLYLRFVKGVLDSKDLPLNVSREILQNNKAVESMKSAVTKRVLDMLSKLAKKQPEDYQAFWDEFGQVIKEGMAEDFANKEKVSKLLRFSSTHNGEQTQTVSLEDYVSRMKEEQQKIYYITAENFNAAKNSPHLEIFRKKGIEVLLLHDRIDEWMTSYLTEFDGKPLQNIAKGELDLGDLDDEKEKEEQEKIEKDNEDLVKRIKDVLGDKVNDVRVTHRLTDSPACLVLNDYDMGAQMRHIMKAAGQFVPETKPNFEINPEHPLLERLNEEIQEDRFTDLTNVLFDQASLAEGGQLDDASAYVNRINKLLLELSR